MSDQEIKDAIIERLKEKDITFNPLNLSTMVIIGYMYDMATHGMIETPFVTGERDWIIINTCKEFGLKPSDEDIFNLVNRWEVACRFAVDMDRLDQAVNDHRL